MQTGNLVPNELKYDGYEVLDKYEVTGAAVTNFSFTSLDGDTDEEYILKLSLINGGSLNTPFILLNNDTGSNYNFQSLNGVSTALTAGNSAGIASIVLASTTASLISEYEFTIKSKSGEVRTVLSTQISDITGTTVDRTSAIAYSWNNTADNLTDIKISSSYASGFIGTKAILLRRIRST